MARLPLRDLLDTDTITLFGRYADLSDRLIDAEQALAMALSHQAGDRRNGYLSSQESSIAGRERDAEYAALSMTPGDLLHPR